MKVKSLLIFAFFLNQFMPGHSQTSVIGLNFGYGYSIPLADLSTRYGGHLGFSANAEYQSKGRFSYLIEWRYIFGTTVKSDVLAPFRQEDGLLIGIDGIAADLYYRMRGQSFTIGMATGLGKKRSKPLLGAAVGPVFYKTVILDDNRSYIQPTGVYEQLYDQRTTGFLLKVMPGYHFITDNELINAKLIFDIGLGFSKFNKSSPYNPIQKQSLNDVSLGMTAYWFIPLKKFGETEIKFF